MLSEIIVEPTTVWAAYGGFVLGMFVGLVMVLSEAKRARRRWREARRTWYEIEAVAVDSGTSVRNYRYTTLPIS